MMPPHYETVSPALGERISAGKITFRGFSLRYAEDPRVFDDTAGNQIEVRLELDVQRVGRGLDMEDPPPGSIQERSILTIFLPEVIPSHAYRVEYLGETFTWEAA